MQSFYTACFIYLGGSLLFYLLIVQLTTRARREFVRRFGAGRDEKDFNETEGRGVIEHEAKFNSSFCRAVMVTYMLYHLPGFLFCAFTKRNTLFPAVMLGVSAVVWIGVLFLVYRPG